ncbi:hypothetical protein HKX48_003737 [Thoreauomyces humboldtii]|nr:hypothetical protein HKX48_003737 [Thoreauomyces humboldtii]
MNDTIGNSHYQALPKYAPAVPLFLWPIIFEYVGWPTAKNLILLCHDVKNVLSQHQIRTAQVKHLLCKRATDRLPRGYSFTDGVSFAGHEILSKESPVTVAARRGRLDAIKILVNDFDFGSEFEDCQYPHMYMYTFPVCATLTNDFEVGIPIMKFLLENGLVTDSEDLLRAVIIAAEHQKLEYLEFLLPFAKHGCFTYPNYKHGIALTAAVIKGSSPCVDLLLAHGADPNGRSDLLLRALNKPKFSVKKLLDYGLKPTVEAISQAFEVGDVDNARLLLDRMDRTDLVVELINRGADVLHGDGKPLAVASEAGSLKTLKFLLDAGCDPRAGNGKALVQAVVSDGVDATSILSLLLDRGADPAVRCGRALREAASYGDTDMVRILLAGQIWDGPIPGLHKALCAAVASGSLGTLKLILDAGANPAGSGGSAGERGGLRHLVG